MPQDIRSFFKPGPKTTSAFDSLPPPSKQSPSKTSPSPKKKTARTPSKKTKSPQVQKTKSRSEAGKASKKKVNGHGNTESVVIDDDSDSDVIEKTPPRNDTKKGKLEKKDESKTRKGKKRLVISDSESESEKLSKSEIIDVSDDLESTQKKRKRQGSRDERKTKTSRKQASDAEDDETRKKFDDAEKKSKRKKAMVIDSESDEDVVVTEKKPRKPRKKKVEEPLVGVSDDDTPKPNPLMDAFSHAKPASDDTKVTKVKVKTPEVKKAVTVSDFFGEGEVHRSEGRSAANKRKSEQLEDHDDDDFEQTLAQIDLDNLEQPAKKKKIDDKSNNESLSEKVASKQKSRSVLVDDTPAKPSPLSPTSISPPASGASQEIQSRSSQETRSRSSQETRSRSSQEIRWSSSPASKSSTVAPSSGGDRKPTAEVKTTPVKSQKSPSSKPTSVTTPAVSKGSATPSSDTKKASYRSYMQRTGPQAIGSKEIPEGAPNCLEGLTFVITGVQESIDRDELKSLLERHGAKVTSSLSKKTSYLITGREAGESKLQKAKQFNTNIVNEDEVFELIKTKPGKVSKYELEASKSLEKEKKQGKSKAPDKKAGLEPMPVTPSKSQPDSDSQTSQLTASPQITASKPGEELLWVDKYKPKTLKNIIGQQGDKSNAKKLSNWLRCWYSNIRSGKKPAFGNRWNDDGSGYRSALLSGPPGIGKTTTAQLVCRELGFSFIEMNASDARSKKTIDGQVAEMLQSTSLDKMFGGSSAEKASSGAPTHCLIMDEVDGMAGNEDRGGMAELIALIKKSSIPVICICNDRQSPKVRSLANHCFDLRFQKPRLEQIKSAMMSIAFKEGLKVPPPALDEIIRASNNDIRQVIHNLSMWSARDKALTYDQTKKDARSAQKDISVGPFEVIRKVFAPEEAGSSLNDKSDLFFNDYSIGPLFVQENYIHVQPAAAKGDANKQLSLLACASDSIADGDVISAKIRSGQNWSLLPSQAILSSVIPGDLMRGYMPHMVNFPAWLGKNSSRNKTRRLLEDINSHMILNVSCSKEGLNMDYRTYLRSALYKPLLKEDGSGVQETMALLEEYDMTKEDLDSLLEISMWSGMQDPMSQVQTKTKAALTRKCNQSTRKLPYAVGAAVKAKRGGATPDPEGLEGLDEERSGPTLDDESDDDITKISSIKEVKPKKVTKKVDKPAAVGKGKGRGKKSK